MSKLVGSCLIRNQLHTMKHTYHTDPFDYMKYEAAPEQWPLTALAYALWLTPGVLFLGWIIIRIVTT